MKMFKKVFESLFQKVEHMSTTSSHKIFTHLRFTFRDRKRSKMTSHGDECYL
jgi:hypothetical protein